MWFCATLHESQKKISNLMFLSIQTLASLAACEDWRFVLGSPKKLLQFMSVYFLD